MSEHIVSQRQELTAEYLRSILNYDQESGVFTWKVSTSNRVKVGDAAGFQGGNGYLLIMVQGRRYKVHRLAWLYMSGEWPKLDIDHINRDRTDNRIENLRDVSRKQNLQNASKRSDNTSGHPGVSWHKASGKWQAKIEHNYKGIHLGLFTDIEEANAARKAGELKYWGVNRAD